MPQSVGYGEAEILRVGIRAVKACPPSDCPRSRIAVGSAAKCRTGVGHVRRFRNVGGESGLLPTPERLRAARVVAGLVPAISLKVAQCLKAGAAGCLCLSRGNASQEGCMIARRAAIVAPTAASCTRALLRGVLSGNVLIGLSLR